MKRFNRQRICGIVDKLQIELTPNSLLHVKGVQEQLSTNINPVL